MGSVLVQAQSLLIALPIGFALGLLYDLMRPARRRASPRREFLLDFLFWLTVCAVVFLCAPILSAGYVRIALVLAYAAGALVYFKIFSRPFRALSQVVERCLRAVFDLLSWPFRWISAILTAQWLKLFLHFKKTAKNIFSFSLQWFRIKAMLKRSRSAVEPSSEQKEEAPYDKNQKGWSCD